MTKEMRRRLERFVRFHNILRWQSYLVFYKAVTRRYESPFAEERLRFRPYTAVTATEVNTDPRWSCGAAQGFCLFP